MEGDKSCADGLIYIASAPQLATALDPLAHHISATRDAETCQRLSLLPADSTERAPVFGSTESLLLKYLHTSMKLGGVNANTRLIFDIQSW